MNSDHIPGEVKHQSTKVTLLGTHQTGLEVHDVQPVVSSVLWYYHPQPAVKSLRQASGVTVFPSMYFWWLALIMHSRGFELEIDTDRGWDTDNERRCSCGPGGIRLTSPTKPRLARFPALPIYPQVHQK